MNTHFFKILAGIILLLGFIYTGIPFEIENPNLDMVFRVISFLIVFTLIYFVLRKAQNVKTKIIRLALFSLIGFFSILFILGTFWNDVLRKSSHGTWYNLEICVNEFGTKILRQIRETSGSIYDYRDRVVLYEFNDYNRISINTNVNYYRGPWTVFNVETGKTKEVKYIE
mgnify:CR=1 FL=1